MTNRAEATNKIPKMRYSNICREGPNVLKLIFCATFIFTLKRDDICRSRAHKVSYDMKPTLLAKIIMHTPAIRKKKHPNKPT